jgi:predicted 3-demethylubiquinone-9 3-methyltransferase (glyoxalase superfamily)
MTTAQKITPCLWFNFNAEEAVNYYLIAIKLRGNNHGNHKKNHTMSLVQL